MTHTLSAHMTAALALAAFTAVGCSSNSGSTDTHTQARQPTQAGPTSAGPTTPPPTAVPGDQTDDEGFVGVSSETGPASFADGEAAYQAKDYAHATRVFVRYTDQRPGNAWGHFMLGLSSWKRGDLSTAERAFGKSLEIDPDHVKSLVNLSRVLLEAGRAEDALDTLMKAADLEPTSAAVYRLLGRAFAERRQTTDAEDAYRRAIQLDDHDAWAMNNLGLLFIQEQRASEAVPLLARAIQIRADVPSFHNNLGMALEHTGYFADAAAAYSGALTADPGHEKAQQNLARVEQVKRDAKEPFDLEAAATRYAEIAVGADATGGGATPSNEAVQSQVSSAGAR